jgi:hypothetical protein
LGLKRFNKTLFRKLILAWVGAFFSPKYLASIKFTPLASVSSQLQISDSHLPPSKKSVPKGEDFQSKIDQLLSDDTLDVGGFHSQIAQMRLFLSLLDDDDLNYLKRETALAHDIDDGTSNKERNEEQLSSSLEPEERQFSVEKVAGDASGTFERQVDEQAKLSEEYDSAWNYLRKLDIVEEDPALVTPQALLPFVPLPPALLEGRAFSLNGCVFGSSATKGSVLAKKAPTNVTEGRRSILKRLCAERDNSENEEGNVMDEYHIEERQKRWAAQVCMDYPRVSLLTFFFFFFFLWVLHIQRFEKQKRDQKRSLFIRHLKIKSKKEAELQKENELERVRQQVYNLSFSTQLCC